MWPYCLVLINAPLILLATLLYSGKDARTSLLFLLIIIAVHSTALQVASVEPSIRHHHATAIPLAMSLSLIAGSFIGKRNKTRAK